jgi:hypothetical protein
LGRSLLLTDQPTIKQMHDELVAHDCQFDNLIECVVKSPQFLNKRGRDDLEQR